jgi:hypothetical protein
VTVATELFCELHVADAVTSFVVPSEYATTAVNCFVVPFGIAELPADT